MPVHGGINLVTIGVPVVDSHLAGCVLPGETFTDVQRFGHQVFNCGISIAFIGRVDQFMTPGLMRGAGGIEFDYSILLLEVAKEFSETVNVKFNGSDADIFIEGFNSFFAGHGAQ